MDTFAFIIHPIDPKRDVSRKFPLLGKYLTVKQINFFSTFFPPIYISEITGIRSEATGKEVRGWFVACPFTPARMMELPEKTVYRKIVQTGRMAEKLGARILGLGAFTSVVGDAGVTIASQLDIPVTTGDSYTVSVAVKAVLRAAAEMRIPTDKATAAVVGGTGAIGKVCAQLLAGQVAELYLIGRDRQKAERTAAQIQAAHPRAKVIPSVDVNDLKKAELILTVTSDTDVIIHSEHLKPGSVICDVSRPRDVSPDVAAKRPDILVIDGGVVDVPGSVNFNFDFGFPPGKAYACMAETIALALEGRYQDYTLGKQILRSQVEEIDTIASKHGFRLSGFRSFEKSLSAEHIERTWQFAQSAVQSS
ncbi:MAG: shikimate dehydrogenase [Anaerolineales bacterium]